MIATLQATIAELRAVNVDLRATITQLQERVRVTVHGVSWERAPGDWSCHVRRSLKAAWDQAEAGRSWGMARSAMLAVQTSAR